MTWTLWGDANRLDDGIFNLTHAFNKTLCINRLIMWLSMMTYFFTHVIVMWGRWTTHDSIWFYVALGSAFSSVLFNCLSAYELHNPKDPYRFNQVFLKVLYIIVTGISFKQLYEKGEYSLGAWLVPGISLVLLGITGYCFVREIHRAWAAFSPRITPVQQRELSLYGESIGVQSQSKFNNNKAFIAYASALMSLLVMTLPAYSMEFIREYQLCGGTMFLIYSMFVEFVFTAFISENKIKTIICIVAWNLSAVILSLLMLVSPYIILGLSATFALISVVFRIQAGEMYDSFLIGRWVGLVLFPMIPLAYIAIHDLKPGEQSGFSSLFSFLVSFIGVCVIHSLWSMFKDFRQNNQ
jgi:hypothetical protein